MDPDGIYQWVKFVADPIKSGPSEFECVSSDGGLDLIQLKGTAGPWQRFALSKILAVYNFL